MPSRLALEPHGRKVETSTQGPPEWAGRASCHDGRGPFLGVRHPPWEKGLGPTLDVVPRVGTSHLDRDDLGRPGGATCAEDEDDRSPGASRRRGHRRGTLGKSERRRVPPTLVPRKTPGDPSPRVQRPEDLPLTLRALTRRPVPSGRLRPQHLRGSRGEERIRGCWGTGSRTSATR